MELGLRLEVLGGAREEGLGAGVDGRVVRGGRPGCYVVVPWDGREFGM